MNVVHNEDVAASRADFLDAVLSENNDREDLDPIERAIGIETMVAELGGADQVAEHYEKTKGWVSQQRKLLKLTPALQALISTGDMAVRVGREIAGLPQEEQAAAWAAELERREASKAVPRIRASTRSTVPPPPVQNASPKRKELTSPQPDPEPEVRDQPDLNQAGPPAGDHRFTAVNRDPEQRPEDDEKQARPPLPDIVTVGAMPWGNPEAVARIAGEWMSEENRHTLGKLLLTPEPEEDATGL